MSARNILTGIIVLAVIAFGIRQYMKYRVAPELAFAEMKLVDSNGEQVDLTKHKGKTVVLNFYQTWCGPCFREMPHFEQASKELGDEFVFLIVTDEPFSNKTARFQQLAPSATYYQTTISLAELGVNTYPTTYVINAAGEEVYNKIGADDWASTESIQRFRDLAKK